ncbi:MAG: helix-turn-helix domain-containing protein [candidate division WOR-3 bacterium]|nr:helix-turn-helix domain-containing protein [candidate division WOR-3 bacterium]
MSKKTSVLDKEIAKLLKSTREKAGLYQAEVAKRIGLSNKSGKGYVSHLEKGRVKNPPIGTILLYLRACGESWSEFFKHLDAIDFRTRHERMISQLPKPPEQRKIQRDAMRYEIGIEFPSKEKPKRDIDFDRLKSRIETKVTPFLIKNDIAGNQASLYQKFTKEYFDFMATLNKSGMKAVTERYQRAGLKINILYGLKKIINSVIRAEIKRILAKKPLPSGKQQKMAIGFTKYRIRIEKIEAETHKLLCELSVPTPWFALYKGFTRECYRVLKKYYGRNQELLNKTLFEIIERWQKEGLKEGVLLKLKDKIISVFGTMRLKGEI